MTRAERRALEAILEDAIKTRQALDLFEADRESGIGTALLGARLDLVLQGLRAVLGKKNEHLPDTDKPA
jgi:hypothetical protein